MACKTGILLAVIAYTSSLRITGQSYGLKVCKDFENNTAPCIDINCSALHSTTASNLERVEMRYFCDKFQDVCNDTECKVIVYHTMMQHYQNLKPTTEGRHIETRDETKIAYSSVVAAITLSTLAVSSCVVLAVFLFILKSRLENIKASLENLETQSKRVHKVASLTAQDCRRGQDNKAFITDTGIYDSLVDYQSARPTEPNNVSVIVDEGSSYYHTLENGELNNNDDACDVTQSAGAAAPSTLYEDVMPLDDGSSVDHTAPAREVTMRIVPGRSMRRQRASSSSSSSQGSEDANGGPTVEPETVDEVYKRRLNASRKKEQP